MELTPGKTLTETDSKVEAWTLELCMVFLLSSAAPGAAVSVCAAAREMLRSGRQLAFVIICARSFEPFVDQCAWFQGEN